MWVVTTSCTCCWICSFEVYITFRFCSTANPKRRFRGKLIYSRLKVYPADDFLQEFSFPHQVYKLQQIVSMSLFLGFYTTFNPKCSLLFLRVQTLIVGCEAGAVQRAPLTSLPHVDTQWPVLKHCRNIVFVSLSFCSWQLNSLWCFALSNYFFIQNCFLLLLIILLILTALKVAVFDFSVG